jgi:hypothetical protein
MNNYPDWIQSTSNEPSSPMYSEKPCCKFCDFQLETEQGDHETPTLTWCDNLSCDNFEVNVK